MLETVSFSTQAVLPIPLVCANSTNVGSGYITWTAMNATATFIFQTRSMDGYYAALGFSNNRMMV